ncbi:hypothetical protein AAE478_003055 [Parahypoxylon ruwenzoriense]
MAKAYCAYVISNLEGLKALSLPTGDDLDLTETAIDRRVRRLESLYLVSPPPPMLEPSWDSLMWRVCRLACKTPPGVVLQKAPRLYTGASLSLLKCLVASMEAQDRLVWPEKEDLEEEALLSLVGQWLLHFAGQRRFYIRKEIKLELEDLCSLALDLSLEAEHRPYPPGRHLGLMPPRTVTTSSYGPKAACCGCCSCYCHNSKSRRDSSVDSYNSLHKRRQWNTRWQIAGWFKKLAFWRKKRAVDDASSTSGTVVSV